MDNESIKIEITNNEALVLFEIVSRYSDTDKLTIEHPAEQQALFNLACALEKLMPQPFEADYKKTLESARQALQK
jgi:hypothetical protein